MRGGSSNEPPPLTSSRRGAIATSVVFAIATPDRAIKFEAKAHYPLAATGWVQRRSSHIVRLDVAPPDVITAGPSTIHLPTADHREPLVLSARDSLTSIQRHAQNVPVASANNMTQGLRDDGDLAGRARM
jgi:hypothetical protein